CPSLAVHPARARVGLWLSQRQHPHAIHSRKFFPADPARLRHCVVSCAGADRNPATRRQPSGPHHSAVAGRHLGRLLCPLVGGCHLFGGPAERAPVPDHPPLLEPSIRDAGHLASGRGDMAMIRDTVLQAIAMLAVLLLAPLLTGVVRKAKARLLRRIGPPLVQPYRDLWRLFRKDVVLAENASWLFRATPYLVFATTWVAASLVPTFATGLPFNWTADLIAI